MPQGERCHGLKLPAFEPSADLVVACGRGTNLCLGIAFSAKLINNPPPRSRRRAHNQDSRTSSLSSCIERGRARDGAGDGRYRDVPGAMSGQLRIGASDRPRGIGVLDGYWFDVTSAQAAAEELSTLCVPAR